MNCTFNTWLFTVAVTGTWRVSVLEPWSLLFVNAITYSSSGVLSLATIIEPKGMMLASIMHLKNAFIFMSFVFLMINIFFANSDSTVSFRKVTALF